MFHSCSAPIRFRKRVGEKGRPTGVEQITVWRGACKKPQEFRGIEARKRAVGSLGYPLATLRDATVHRPYLKLAPYGRENAFPILLSWEGREGVFPGDDRPCFSTGSIGA